MYIKKKTKKACEVTKFKFIKSNGFLKCMPSLSYTTPTKKDVIFTERKNSYPHIYSSAISIF